MGGKRIRDLKVRVGRECCISRGWARLSSEGIQAGRVKGGSHSAGRCGISRSRKAVPGVRAVKKHLEKGSGKHFK